LNTTLFNNIDYLAVPIAIIVIIFIAYFIKKKQPQAIQLYFYNALLLRLLGSLCIAVVYQYIYGNGDTFVYYAHTQIISSFRSESFYSWWQIIINSPTSSNVHSLACMDRVLEEGYISSLVYSIPENANVAKIASVFNIICFNSYPAIAMFFGFFSFLGCWYIFRVFYQFFPDYKKQLALLCLFLPSLWFWGNGILKDPISLVGLGIVVFNVFCNNKFWIKRLVLIALGSAILLNTKSYIFSALLLALILAYSISIFKKFDLMGKLIFFVVIFGSLGLFYSQSSILIFDVFKEIISTSQLFLNSYSSVSDEGTGGIVKQIDPTPFGFLNFLFQGLINVFLRPFPWELRTIIYVFSILENLLLYYILFKKIKITSIITPSPKALIFIRFAILFFIILGIIIGITTFNLGTISRYRLPILPFLFAGILCYRIIRVNKKNVQHI